MDERTRQALHAVHADLLVLLADFVRVMEANGLPYSLMCGTLLGAVRHKGFIPWDDDIDLVLPRESYERFAALYPTQCAEGFYLDLTDTWVPRVRKQGGEQLAFLDLFILDPLPDGKPARAWKLLRLKALQGMLKEHTDYRRFSLPRRVLLGATALLGKPFSRALKLRLYARLCRVGSPASARLHMANSAFHLLAMPFEKSDFKAPALAAFETLTVRIPQDAHSILVKLYGLGYMTPPPESERAPLHLNL